VTYIPWKRIGSEFMPPLNEGDLLYMPTTLPGISITKAKELLQQTDRIIASFPEVHHVFGKVGRAETATDPAPLSMLETTIMLKPESEWREGVTIQKLVEDPGGHALHRYQDTGGDQGYGGGPSDLE
jgi:Cu(I)/Ag(I) efflux system membrane protein CusA/SilA